MWAKSSRSRQHFILSCTVTTLAHDDPMDKTSPLRLRRRLDYVDVCFFTRRCPSNMPWTGPVWKTWEVGTVWYAFIRKGLSCLSSIFCVMSKIRFNGIVNARQSSIFRRPPGSTGTIPCGLESIGGMFACLERTIL